MHQEYRSIACFQYLIAIYCKFRISSCFQICLPLPMHCMKMLLWCSLFSVTNWSLSPSKLYISSTCCWVVIIRLALLAVLAHITVLTHSKMANLGVYNPASRGTRSCSIVLSIAETSARHYE